MDNRSWSARWTCSTRLQVARTPLFFFLRCVQGDQIGSGHAGRRGCRHSNSHGWLIKDGCLAVQYKASFSHSWQKVKKPGIRWCSLRLLVIQWMASPAGGRQSWRAALPRAVIPASHTVFAGGSLSNLYIYCDFTSVLFLWASFEILEKKLHPHSKTCPALRRYPKRPLAKFQLIRSRFQRFMPWKPSALPRMVWDICQCIDSSIHITHSSGQSNGAMPCAGHRLLSTSSYAFHDVCVCGQRLNAHVKVWVKGILWPAVYTTHLNLLLRSMCQANILKLCAATLYMMLKSLTKLHNNPWCLYLIAEVEGRFWSVKWKISVSCRLYDSLRSTHFFLRVGPSQTNFQHNAWCLCLLAESECTNWKRTSSVVRQCATMILAQSQRLLRHDVSGRHFLHAKLLSDWAKDLR